MIAQSQLAAISGGSTVWASSRRGSTRNPLVQSRRQGTPLLHPRISQAKSASTVAAQAQAQAQAQSRAISSTADGVPKVAFEAPQTQARAQSRAISDGGSHTADGVPKVESSQGLIRNHQHPFLLNGSDDVTAPEHLVADNSISRRSFVALSAVFPALLLAPPSTSASPDSTSSSAGSAIIPSCPQGSTVEIQIGDNCGLGVAIYPDFSYSPGGVGGGGGSGTATDLDDGSDRIEIVFDPETLFIPPLQYNTTRFLGLPLPPPLKIEIAPAALRGYLERSTGKVELTFISKFFFTAGPIYTAPPLTVETILTTEISGGPMRSAQGSRLDAYGKCTLVGVARVPPVNDAFLDTFLLLPTDVVAILPAELWFKPARA
ncbi:hypothetical protein CLOM_g23736 [Closterium sp. NIES-68]|nr:hypothetical protein CLOM_g23736 [Closterium sp. NIES-68]GJP66431.1 hypothetical protein CLOP_g23365 [Closterium sp. NIES-67]